jgi:hypothetical protein
MTRDAYSWVTGLILLFSSGVVAAADSLTGEDAVALSLGVEYFSWREYSDNRQLLEERGPRMFAELGMRKSIGNSDFVSLLGRLYLASVHYDGETTGSASPIPITSNSIYGGWGAEANYHLHLFALPAESSDIYLTFGLGYEAWLRSIQDTRAAGVETPVPGYLEKFQIPYLRLGFLYHYEGRIYLQAGAKVPLDIKEEVGFSRFYSEDDPRVRLDNVFLEPQAQTSLYASLRYFFNRSFGLHIYYDSYRMQASEKSIVTANGQTLYWEGSSWKVNPDSKDRPLRVSQPESRQDTIGLLFSYLF